MEFPLLTWGVSTAYMVPTHYQVKLQLILSWAVTRRKAEKVVVHEKL